MSFWWSPLLPGGAELLSGGGGGGFQPAWIINDEDLPRYDMKKNVASQVVGIQMVSATDGSAFTGAVTALVTGDGGTQATGSVGSGACTHEGNGYHTYAPAQAETNYDQIGFTFIGTGAVPRSVTIYTSFPQTGDAYAKAVDVEADTQDLQTQVGVAGAGLTNINLPNQTMDIVGNITGNLSGSVGSVTGLTASDVGAIKAKTDNLPSDPADASVIAGRFDTLDTSIGDLPTATENADALLNRDMSAVSDTNSRSPLNALRAIRNKTSIAGGTLTVTKEDDADPAWTASVSTDANAEPIIGVDPA